MNTNMDAKQLVDALTAKGLTQKQIVERSGVPQATISKISTARVGDVMSKTYLALLNLYHEVSGKKKARA